MNEKQLQEIEARDLPMLADVPYEVLQEDIRILINEVRRLRAVVEAYADHNSWGRSGYANEKDRDLWAWFGHGYTRAEECLREDGE
jgi:hypothetical protein